MKTLIATMLASLLCACGGYAASGDRDAAASGGNGVTVFGTIDSGISRTTTQTGR